MVGAVVSICGPLWVRPVSDRLEGVPGAIVDRHSGRQIDRGGGERGGVLSSRDSVGEGQALVPEPLT